MKVEILEDKTFSALDPQRIEHFLVMRGWNEISRTNDEVVILELKTKSDISRVWLPLDRNFLDFDEGIGKVVRELAKSENRSQLEVLDDLATVAVGDVVRLTAYDPLNRESTTIPLADGLALVEKAKKLATAAALSTESKKPVFSTYRTPAVSDFMDKVRLGQTERGSYRIKLISPLPIQPNLPGTETDPFERRVIINLVDSLSALKEVSRKSLRRGNYQFEAFQEIVSEGVSANLCEALTERDPNRYQKPVEISVTWSDIIPAPTLPSDAIDFNPDVLSFIEKAGRDFRERNPENISLRGYVVRLEKKTRTAELQNIVIAGIVDERVRKVHVDLQDTVLNEIAIDAYKEAREISVDGILERKGHVYTLTEPRNLRAI